MDAMNLSGEQSLGFEQKIIILVKLKDGRRKRNKL